MIPITEFRFFPVSSEEPGDRTVQGTSAGSGSVLDLGMLDTTDEARELAARALWWRVCDMNGAGEIRNIRVWLEGTGSVGGSAEWFMDITDTWTRGKTPVQVETGNPGLSSLAEGAPGLTRIGGGAITGTAHEETSAYIYLSGRFGVNVPTGKWNGLRLVVKYDFR